MMEILLEVAIIKRVDLILSLIMEMVLKETIMEELDLDQKLAYQEK